MSETTADHTQPDTDPEQFAIVEVFGHRRHVGRIMEVEQFGAKMLRIDIPLDGDFETGYKTHFYGGSSIFSLTPTDLATVVRANRQYRPPAITHATPLDDEHDDGLGGPF